MRKHLHFDLIQRYFVEVELAEELVVAAVQEQVNQMNLMIDHKLKLVPVIQGVLTWMATKVTHLDQLLCYHMSHLMVN